METKTIPTLSLKIGMRVVGNVAFEGAPLPCYAPTIRNVYRVVSRKHVKGDRVLPGFHVVVLSLPGLLDEGREEHMLVMRVHENSWWHVPVDT